MARSPTVLIDIRETTSANEKKKDFHAIRINTEF